MAEVTFRIPSKAVTYGYIEFPLTVEDGASPEALASVYVNFVYAFQKEEQAALKRIAEGPSPAPKQAAPTPSAPDVHEAATEAIKDGLGATEVDEVIGETIKNAAKIESEKPWDKAVDAKPKPWETGETQAPKPAAVVTEGW